ncbi:MAG TPA: long-chain fatty acid--CoA ligase [Myxococcales bacterium]|jgi:long-chain acyl-CoA synthetase
MPTRKLEITAGEDASNLVRMFLRHARHPERESARHKVRDQWVSVTWGEALSRIRALSEALVGLGVQPGDRVCLYAQTRLEWCLMDLAILGAGAATVPIYASNTSQETEYIIRDSGSKVVVVDHDKAEGRLAGRYSRVRDCASRTPEVQHYVAFDLASKPEERLLGLAELEERGRAALAAAPDALEKRAQRIQPGDLSCVLYTSGTMGTPKGVMLTHANWVAQSYAVMQQPILQPGDQVMLFLPLAHSFARAVESCWAAQDTSVIFAESVEKLLANAAESKPTVLPAVPRVFEKAYNQVLADGGSKPGLQGLLFRRAMQHFEEYAAAKAAGRNYFHPEWLLLKKVIFGAIAKKLDAKFGGKVRSFISGGAPLAPKIAYFFDLCGLNILEGYGLTETCAPTHANILGANRIGSVGPAFPDVEVKLGDDDEVLLRGPTIMKGYYQLPEETAAALTPDGWLRTGDIGEVDADGYLRITDRKKDLIKTSGGKYVAPAVLENALKTEPLIGQVSVHGEGRKYVAALLTLSADNAKRFAEQNKLGSDSPAQLAAHPEVRARIQAAVDALNATQPSYATIKKFALLEREWSQETGELTPTLKVKRSVIEQRFKAVLDSLFE